MEAHHRKSSVAEIAEDNNTLHVDDDVMRKASVAVDNFAGLSADAKDGTDHEHAMSLMEAIKLYPKAVGWSVLLSTAIVMEGYDVVLLSSFYALPQFNEKYGVSTPFSIERIYILIVHLQTLDANSEFTIPAPWKSGLSNGALCGEILGLFITGIVSEKYG